MKNVAEFKRVSLPRWIEYIKENDLYDEIGYPYGGDSAFDRSRKEIKLPKRATKQAAGYDFFAPYDFELKPRSSILIFSGIRVKILRDDYCLILYPKSGLAKKYGIRLKDTVGVIDADYYNSANEGIIFVNLVNPSNETVRFFQGDKIYQGVFHEYGLVVGDDEENLPTRDGGFGSTGK